MNEERRQKFLKGIDEFNKLDFFDCHDTLEEVWDEVVGNDRKFYQGLIHVAVGFYHLTNENPKGSLSQFEKALAKLSPYGNSHLGVELAELKEKVAFWLKFSKNWLEKGSSEKINLTLIPKIILID